MSNHIALTWTAEDLEACADLNLPCGDVADMLVEPLSEPGAAHCPGGPLVLWRFN